MKDFIKRFMPVVFVCIMVMLSSMTALAAEEGFEKNNLETMYYKTLSGTDITNQASAKPKLMVYLNESGGCALSNTFVKNIQSLNFDRIDTVIVGIYTSTGDSLRTFKANNGQDNNDIIYAYSPTGSAGWEVFSYVFHGGGSNTAKVPVIAYIDKNNKVRLVDQGDCNAVRLADNCSKFFGIDITKKSDTPEKISSANVTVSNLLYTGTTQSPKISAKNSQGRAISSKNYTVTLSPKTVKGIGKYTLKIKFKGSYSGTVSKSFYVLPKKPALTASSISATSAQIKYSRAAGATGYEIQYSYSKKFAEKYTKTVTNDKNSFSKRVKGLKSGSTVYVRVRAFTSKNGRNYKSAWSKIAEIKLL